MSRIVSSLFCYGTLEFPEIMYGVTGEIFPSESGFICDYARYLVRGEVYPGLIYEPGAITAGTLYHKVKPRHMRLLDAYEGGLYSKELLTIIAEDDTACKALVYVVPSLKKAALSSNSWDKEIFSRQYYQRFLQQEFKLVSV